MEQVPEWFEVKVETAIRSRLSTAQREALINSPAQNHRRYGDPAPETAKDKRS